MNIKLNKIKEITLNFHKLEGTFRIHTYLQWLCGI